MRISLPFRRWSRRVKQRFRKKASPGPLREFVYLDEVSVHSLLASRKGGITAEFTESQSSSSSSELGSSLGTGIPGISAGLSARMQATNAQGSQVLRRAVVQTHFKELYEMEREALLMKVADYGSPPCISSMSDLVTQSTPPNKEPWIVDPRQLGRGALIEVAVEIEADPIFRMATLVSTFDELIADNACLFGRDVVAQLPEVRAVAKLLESLLTGLVPIQGRLLDYDCVSFAGHELLVHRSIVDQISRHDDIDIRPAFVVGVAQRDLFWKDLRRVLFSKGHYTAFCRVETNGLSDRWSPVKLADVLSGITDALDEVLQNFREIAQQAMASVGEPPTAGTMQDANDEHLAVVRCYVNVLAEHHLANLSTEDVDSIVSTVPRGSNWFDSVDSRRLVFRALTQHVDDKLGKQTSNAVAYELREILSDDSMASQKPIQSYTIPPTVERNERFWDAEIIAIYW